MNLFLSIQSLYQWSSNFHFPSPFSVFLDLVGYSEEEFGESLVQENISSILGYKELDLLGLALQEYADDPGRADDMIRFLLFCESEQLDWMNEDDEDTLLAMNDFIPWYQPSTSVLVAV
jgi:hypothetical protein